MIASTAFLAACGTDLSPLTVSSFNAPTLDVASSACVGSGAAVSRVRMDLSRGKGMVLGASIKSVLGGNAEGTVGRIDSNTATIDTAVVTFRGKSLAQPQVTTTTLIQVPSSGVGNGLFTLLPSGLSTLEPDSEEDGEFVARVAFSGKLLDGSTILVTPAELPVSTCNGCLRLPCEDPDKVDLEDGLPLVKDTFRRVDCGADSRAQAGTQACVKVTP